MKTSDKNQIFEFLKGSVYSLNDFKIVESSKTIKSSTAYDFPITIITYKETHLQFEISNPYETYDQYKYRFRMHGPGYRWSDSLPKNKVGVFAEIFMAFQFWLAQHVKTYEREMAETDLWSEYLKIPRSLTFDQGKEFDISKFNENEKEQLKLALVSLRKLITDKYAQNQPQTDIVSQNIDYLIEKVDSLNKFDWRSVAVSIIINICTSLMLEPDKAKTIWDWFVKLVSTIPHLPL